MDDKRTVHVLNLWLDAGSVADKELREAVAHALLRISEAAKLRAAVTLAELQALERHINSEMHLDGGDPKGAEARRTPEAAEGGAA